MADHVKVDAIGRIGLGADPDALLTVGNSPAVMTESDVLALVPWAWWDAADWNGDFIDEYPGGPVGHSIAEGDYVPRWHDRAGTSPVHGSRDWVLGSWGGTNYNTDNRKMRYYNTAGSLPRRVLGGPPGSTTGGYLSTYDTSGGPQRFYSQLAGGEGITPNGSTPNFWTWTFVAVVAGIGGATHSGVFGCQFVSPAGMSGWWLPGEGIWTGGSNSFANIEDKTQAIPSYQSLSQAVPYGNTSMHTGMPLRSDFRVHIARRSPGQAVTIDNRPPFNGRAWAYSYWVDGFGQQASEGAYSGVSDRPLWFHGLAVHGGGFWTPSNLYLVGQFYAEVLVFDRDLDSTDFQILSAYLNRKYAKPVSPIYDMLSVSSIPEIGSNYVQIDEKGRCGLSSEPTSLLTLAQRSVALDFLKVSDNETPEPTADYCRVDHEGLVGLSVTPDGSSLVEMKERATPQDFLTLKDGL